MTEQPSSLDPRLQRIAFIGPFGVGKSTAIRTVSDISVLGSEAEISPHVLHDDIASGKHLTTVAFEYGEIRTSDEERFALFGLPGQDRFEHMWRMLIPSTIGVVLLLNSQDSMDVCETWLSRLADYYKKKGMPVKSHGCCTADNWSDVQFQRMPNVSLLPGTQDRKWEDLISATDSGIAIIGDGSFSIDQQRFNAQFGGQVFYEIKGGKIAGMLKDVAYQMKTTEFWNSMDMIGGKSSYELGASFFDGKGQPGQIGSVSHGCVPSRFRNINVINTGRKA